MKYILFDKDSLILTARSRRCFALSVTTDVFLSALAWTDGTAVIPISSRASLAWHEWLVSTKMNRRIKSSWVKCLEHIEEFRVGSHFALFCSTKPTNFFRGFLASGRSSLRKGVVWKLNPSANLVRQNIYLKQHMCPAYFACYSKKLLSGSPKWDTRLTSQVLLVLSPSIAPFWIQYGGKTALNCRVRPLI